MASIGPYTIAQGLGAGSMSQVYLATLPKLGRKVAIKLLSQEADRPDLRARFEREARAIAALRHPNIVDILDLGEAEDGRPYIVMEYIAGPNTGELLARSGRFPESVLLAVGMELCLALEHAHARGIIHRDIKPENVFVDAGRLVLADFGMVKALQLSSPLGETAARPFTEVVGTPGFMAPEQVKQSDLTARTDLFAVGALLYFLATKELAFAAPTPYSLLELFREHRPRALHDVRLEVSEGLNQVVQDCLAVDPAERPASAVVLRQRLQQLLAGMGAAEPREILRDFEENPALFRQREVRQTGRFLVDRLRLARLDAEHTAAAGIEQALHLRAPEMLQEVSGVNVAPPRRRFRLWWLLPPLFVAGTWLWQRPLAPPSVAPRMPMAQLFFVDVPAGAYLFVAGRALGQAPVLPLVVPVGRARIEIFLPGGERWADELVLPQGDVQLLWREGLRIQPAPPNL
jgi:hypothetical protein